MAKDGTARGGARIGAGRKSKSLDSKILAGQSAQYIPNLPFEADDGEVPPPREFLKSPQRSGIELKAEEIYRTTYKWLKQMGCEKLVSRALIEQYSMLYARYMACEEKVSELGYFGVHPTTKAPMTSPYVSMSQSYAKQANITWAQIYQVVKENASENYLGNPDDEMEILLRRKKK